MSNREILNALNQQIKGLPNGQRVAYYFNDVMTTYTYGNTNTVVDGANGLCDDQW